MQSSKQEWSLVELTDLLKKTAATDKDNLIPIDGLTGAGKSTFGVKACKKGCPWFDMERDILYSRQEVINWVTTAKQGSWGLADEAVNILFKREFAAKQQKFLIKILDMCRDRNLTLFMCIPNFWALDKHVLEGRVRLRVHVARTGFIFMWKPSNNPFAPDRWYRKYNEKVCYNWDYYPNAKRTKGFVGFLKFGDLEVREKAKYLEIKRKKKEEVKRQEEMEEQQENRLKKQSYNQGISEILRWLEISGYLNRRGWLKEVATYLDITPEALRIRLKKAECKPTKTKETKEETYYNNRANIDDFSPTKVGLQHSAI